ncbi:MAG TPA: tripartite tricarboxylate transporter substrate binding protein [Xanthobacteraceae bacterium]|jgi:tripartite-type tricarboxylate transporter receptor subunit TctC
MNVDRRRLLQLAAGTAAVPAWPCIARAQTYPSRPVHVIVGFAAGSASDILSRLVAQSLSARLGQPFVVENRGGAGGTLGADMAARAPADGYTLLYCGNADAISASMYDKLSYNFLRDIAPIASIASGPLVLVVNPSFPAKTVPEFIAYAKANAGKVAFASAGVGSVVHLAGELFMVKTGVQLVHVPYRGLGLAMTDLLGGQVQAIFSTTPPAIGHIKAGRLRALAVTSIATSQSLPDVPALADFLPGYEAGLLSGFGAPRNVPAGVIDQLNKDINAIIAEPTIKARLADLGSVPVAMTPAAFAKTLADETEKWGKVIREAHLKPA